MSNYTALNNASRVKPRDPGYDSTTLLSLFLDGVLGRNRGHGICLLNCLESRQEHGAISMMLQKCVLPALRICDKIAIVMGVLL